MHKIILVTNICEEFFMKKFVVVLASLCLIMVLFGCASKKPATAAQGGKPEWVLKAQRDAPEDVIVGVGTAKLATTNQSMNTSETRARAQISRAMDSMVKNMIEDMTMSSEIDPTAAVSFQSEVTTALSKSRLSGARVVEQNAHTDGAWWTVIYFNRSSARTELSQAEAAAKLAVPYAINLMMQDRMDEKFAQAAKEDWTGYN